MAPQRDRYWRRVRKRATKDARAALLIETLERVVIGIVVTIAAIALLWLWGSEGAPKDAAIERIGPWAVMLVAVYPLVWLWKFIRAPSVLDAELQSLADTLEQQLVSQIEVVWMSNAVREVTGPGSPATIEKKLGQIIVRNKSGLEPVRSVEVTLINYVELCSNIEEDIDASIYSFATQEVRVNLNPGRHVRFNVFEVKYGADKLRLGPFADPRRNNLRRGKYRLSLIASAETGRSVQEDCFLDFDGYQAIEFRRWEPRDTGEWLV